MSAFDYRSSYLFLLILLAVTCNTALGQEPGVPPNIILVMADDLGSEAVGCYGGTSYKTPVLDKMAENGIKFNHGYAYPLCTPTRVSLMTGKYNFRNWKAFGILDPEETTFGHLMQAEGFKTCMVGKWQLQSYDPPGFRNSDIRRNTGMLVDNAGFDEFCMWHTRHTEEKGSRFADPLIYQNGEFLTNTNNKYGPDLYTDYLLDFVSRNKEAPFFVYYPMALTHGPFVPTPLSEEWKDQTLHHVQDKKHFGDMVEYTDKIMGRIMSHLDKEGLAENTLVIFYSDNGTHQSLFSMMGDKKVWGGKTLPNDAGTRVPLIVNWKGKIKAGQVSNEMVSTPDFVPTIFEAIGRELPVTFQTDGQSFYKELIGEPDQRKDWVYIDYNPRPGWDKDHLMPATFVKGERYKLYTDGRFYDVENDELEQKPLKVKSGKLAELKQRYSRILDSLKRYPTIGYLEKFDSKFDKIVPPHTKVEVIASGHTWTEGPVWVPSQQCLLYSDVPRNIAYKWTPIDGKEEYLNPSGYTGVKPRKGGKGSNGLALDNNGNLILCRSGDGEVAKLAANVAMPVPVYQTLAYQYEGKKFNSPNDAVVDKQGNIYFTDPSFGLDKDDPNAKELDFEGVYRISPKGKVSLMTKSWPTPNGVGISPDQKTLYIANSNPAKLIALDLGEDGTASNERVIFDATKLWEKSVAKQRPDGMTINSDGIIFMTGPDGVLVLSQDGKHLGSIKTDKKTSNCTFNEDETVLYVTCDDLVLRVILGYKLLPK
ncbi:MAG: sulfatase-like hydrolase/transferase [Cyclobacteriaceae bacterium]